MQKYVCEPCGYVYDPEVGDRTTESHREQHLKIFRKTGFAQSVVWEKKCLWQSNREWEMPYSGCAASLF